MASLAFGLWAGFITPVALPFIAVFFVSTYLVTTHDVAHYQRGAAIVAIIVLSAGFMTHVVPGFANYKVISHVTFSTGALPYSQYFNYDKALIGLALIALCVPVCRERSRWRAMLKATIPWSLLVFIVVLSLAILIGYVRFDPKFPPEFFRWAWINLFFTCIPEEALFRGFVQQGLQDRLRASRHGELIALTSASVLFGLAHFAGGLRYMFLATVAGFGYGWIYQRTRAIESSILVHFMVNALHFVFFTYPALK
ncbi:MAG: CPBP family intramembrane metalloprotease [Nitrososphaera sp.]|nr:CPBP family intramembrane metalloprotease [Nitrososphaera sp.]